MNSKLSFVSQGVFIIAEAGVNHNGQIGMAKRLIDTAKSAGCDAIKFQTFQAEKFVSRFAPKAEYQKKTTDRRESQLEMIKKLELDEQDHRKMMEYCVQKGIMFLSTPFDLESITLLHNLGLKIFKVSSGDIMNLPYLRKIGGLRGQVILSTGMAEMEDIKKALEVLMGNGTKKQDITVLHCTTAYPAPYEEVNLRAMLAIQETFQIKVGYSDHTQGIEISIAAVALGARVVEKHLTLDRRMEGPDHQSSLEPDEFKAMVQAIRHVEKAMGDGMKRPADSALKIRPAALKSIVAAKSIKKNEVMSDENIAVKRPGTGISPMRWDEVLGKKAVRDFAADELIEI